MVFDHGDGRVTSFRVELVRTPYERSRGLMFRTEMDPGWGMLFLFEAPRVHRFWMQNTYIPLDMVFIDGDGQVVCIVEQTQPLTQDGRGCDQPSLHVLELVGGSAAKHGLRAGQVVRLLDLDLSTPPTPTAP